MYLGYVLMYVTYLVDQYLFQYVQYAIVSIEFLYNSNGNDDFKIQELGKSIFTDEALKAYRIIYHI